jgi:putative sigma-54 modulation protein
MRIEIKSRNGVVVDDDLRARIEKRFEKIGKQVAEVAALEIELSEEKNPSIHDSRVAEATLRLKGTTLRAREASDNIGHAINLLSEDLARQVKKHRDKRRGRRHAGGPEPHAAAP